MLMMGRKSRHGQWPMKEAAPRALETHPLKHKDGGDCGVA